MCVCVCVCVCVFMCVCVCLRVYVCATIGSRQEYSKHYELWFLLTGP